MKFTYYGTAAGGGFPGVFCECDMCVKVRKLGGRNIRTRSQALLDEKLLIDFPQDTYLHSAIYGMPLYRINTVIITHPHTDHLYIEDIKFRKTGYADMKEHKPLEVYGSEAVIDEFVNTPIKRNHLEWLQKTDDLKLHTITPFEPFFAEGYKITPLTAEHGTTPTTMFAIEKDGKALLYAHDSGLFPEETIEYLSNSKMRFDLVLFDCTNGLLELGDHYHMGISGNIVMKEKLEKIGCIDEKTRCILNHFTHKCLACYDDMVPIAEKYGFEVSYDTMTVEF